MDVTSEVVESKENLIDAKEDSKGCVEGEEFNCVTNSGGIFYLEIYFKVFFCKFQCHFLID